jgi:Uma2 family endonuclease
MPVRELVTEPTWEIVELFPAQGEWSEELYMRLPGNRLVEFSDGTIEILPLPTQRHQKMARFLLGVLSVFVDQKNLGSVLVAPFVIRLWPDKNRMPDIVFMFEKNSHRCFEMYWEGADLVMEVVSTDDPERDFIVKKEEYAKAKIPEYWVAHPVTETIMIYVLDKSANRYREAGVFAKGQTAASVLLEGFTVDVTKVFAL